MSDSQEDKKAKALQVKKAKDLQVKKANALMDECAAGLREIADGEVIPSTWKNYFIKAIRPLPKIRGIKFDTEKHAAYAKRITENRDRLNDEQEFGHTAECKDAIAKEFGVSRKTITRDLSSINEVFAEYEMMNPERRKAAMKGITECLQASLKNTDKKEDEIRKKRVEQFNKKNQVTSVE